MRELKSKIEFLWYKPGQVITQEMLDSQNVLDSDVDKWIIKGQVEVIRTDGYDPKLDLNNDGKIDKEDASLAGKLRYAVKKRLKNKDRGKSRK